METLRGVPAPEAASRFAGSAILARARHEARLGFEQELLALAQPLMNLCPTLPNGC